MVSKSKLSVDSVLDLETGYEIRAADFFQQAESIIFRRRRKQEEAVQKKDYQNVYVCYYCKQIIKIKGKPLDIRQKTLHFAHLRDSDDCPVKTDNNYTKEEIQCIKYNGAKESQRHKTLKASLAASLQENEKNNKGVTNVEVEVIFQDKAISNEWKKPDIQCIYYTKKLVLELQLSTTFLSVIVQRELFYKQHKTFILWVFEEMDYNSELQKFTQKDILYSNNRNVFVITTESQRFSAQQGDLVLLCCYHVPTMNENDEIQSDWNQEYVTLSDLKFDEETYKVYYYDSDKAFKALEVEIKTRQTQRKLEAANREIERQEKKRVEQQQQIEKEKEEKERFKQQQIEKQKEEKERFEQYQKEKQEKERLEQQQQIENSIRTSEQDLMVTVQREKVEDILNLSQYPFYESSKQPEISNSIHIVIQTIQDFYDTGSQKFPPTLSKDLIKLSDDATQLLNDYLHTTYDSPFWAFLIENHKPSFSNFMLEHPKIDIEPNSPYQSISAFQKLCMSNLDFDVIGRMFINFLNKDYDFKLCEDEKWILNRMDKKNLNKLSDSEVERTIVMRYIFLLQTPAKIGRMLRILHPVIMPILSFRLDRILGSRFNNLIQVANNVMYHHKEYAHFLLKVLQKEDKNGILAKESFQKKLITFTESRQLPNKDYDDILKIIMPYLFDNQ